MRLSCSFPYHEGGLRSCLETTKSTGRTGKPETSEKRPTGDHRRSCGSILLRSSDPQCRSRLSRQRHRYSRRITTCCWFPFSLTDRIPTRIDSHIMNSTIKAYDATTKGWRLQAFEYHPGSLGDEQVEIRIECCGVCHSDLSMLDDEWGMTVYPLVPGHEVVGRVVAVGRAAGGRDVPTVQGQ